MNYRRMGSHVGTLGVAGLAVGVVAGWVGLARGDGALETAAASTPFIYSLIAVLPFVLIARVALEAGKDRGAPYDSLGKSLPIVLAIGLLGAALACILFLVGATQIPAVFGGEDAEQVMVATRAAVLWTKVGIVVAATGAASIAAAIVGHARARG
jgi:hypothetical protein